MFSCKKTQLTISWPRHQKKKVILLIFLSERSLISSSSLCYKNLSILKLAFCLYNWTGYHKAVWDCCLVPDSNFCVSFMHCRRILLLHSCCYFHLFSWIQTLDWKNLLMLANLDGILSCRVISKLLCSREGLIWKYNKDSFCVSL